MYIYELCDSDGATIGYYSTLAGAFAGLQSMAMENVEVYQKDLDEINYIDLTFSIQKSEVKE